ncbi:MAG: Maf family protein [Hyphomicrobiales bacterium]|nr:Maf family protein [Hyphomicrobiales bacterium]
MLNPDTPEIILASASKSRQALLQGAGVAARTAPADINEKAIRTALQRSGGTTPGDIAEVLARAKAETISEAERNAVVIGADQVLELDGEIFEKPPDMEAARKTILALRGKTHQLHASVAVARAGDAVWAHTETAHMTMRDFDAKFVGRYLSAAGEGVLGSVGAYQLEGVGIHLFSEIKGDYFTILGLPLLPLLDYLRGEGIVAS